MESVAGANILAFYGLQEDFQTETESGSFVWRILTFFEAHNPSNPQRITGLACSDSPEFFTVIGVRRYNV